MRVVDAFNSVIQPPRLQRAMQLTYSYTNRSTDPFFLYCTVIYLFLMQNVNEKYFKKKHTQKNMIFIPTDPLREDVR